MAESASRQSDCKGLGGGEGGGGGEKSSIQRATGYTVRAQPCHTFEFYTPTE